MAPIYLWEGVKLKITKLERLTWKPEWNTGIESIDLQHQKILTAINALNRSFSPEDGPLATKLFDALTAYTRIHFGYEEKLMAQAQFKNLEEQKSEHQAFMDKLEEFRKNTSNPKELDPVMSRMQTYLLDWLIQHILEQDMKYKSAFKKAGIT